MWVSGRGSQIKTIKVIDLLNKKLELYLIMWEQQQSD